ncbi:MAG: CFI-box-CTERM domain-containing protein [Smithella sp.]
MKKGIMILTALFYSFLNCNMLFADSTPEAFIFTDQTGVAMSTTVTSNTITVTGIDTAAPVSITGGTYAINGGNYTSASGTVNDGDTVNVRQTSSENYATKTDTTLTIGGVSDTFSVTTVMFSFTDQTHAELNTPVTSNMITVSCTATPGQCTISIVGGTYSINGEDYTSAVGFVNNGDTVTVQQTSAESYLTKTDATLTIDDFSDTFSVTTKADTPPDQFTFTDQTHVALNTTYTSNTITVSGIHAAAPISITGGTYSINDGDYTSEAGAVNNGDMVTVQVVSSGDFETTTDATLTIAGVSDTFSVTTRYVHESVDDGPCFIATAAFGSPLAGQVQILRQFRDRYLLTHAWGRQFVAWYYQNGPLAAKHIQDKPLLKIAAQLALYPLIGFSALLLSGYLPFVIMGLLLSSLLFLRFRPEKLRAR